MQFHFFDMIQKMYVYFSDFTFRWQVILKYVKNFKLKLLSDIR